ncbi:MAG: hypothetical protein ACTSRU_06320 [Candidatus Hodarchaeales archaeon]
MSKHILKEEAITLEKVKEKLLERDEENSPLNYIQRVTLDYAFRFSKDIPNSELLVDKLIPVLQKNDEVRRILSRELSDDEEDEIRRSRSTAGEKGVSKKREEFISKYARRKAIQLVTINPEGPEDVILVLNDTVPKETLEKILITISDHKNQYKDIVVAEGETKVAPKDQAEDLTFEGFIDEDLE